jgi:hypothetical protein
MAVTPVPQGSKSSKHLAGELGPRKADPVEGAGPVGPWRRPGRAARGGTSMVKKKFYAPALVALTALLVLATTALAAFGENMQVDADLLTSGLHNTVDLGTIAGGSSQSSTSTKVAAATTAGVSATDVSVTIPDPWGSSINQEALSNSSTISFTAPTTAGSYTYTVSSSQRTTERHPYVCSSRVPNPKTSA